MNKKSSNLMVAIDSMTLIWGVRGEGTHEQIQRAAWLFEALESEGAQIIVPAVAASEYLAPVGLSDHSSVLAEISRRFLIMPFDVQCSSLAAQLFVEGKGGINKGVPNARIALKADCLIIATAVRHGAKVFFCGEKEARNRAGKHIEARDLPTMPDNLFPASGRIV